MYVVYRSGEHGKYCWGPPHPDVTQRGGKSGRRSPSYLLTDECCENFRVPESDEINLGDMIQRETQGPWQEERRAKDLSDLPPDSRKPRDRTWKDYDRENELDTKKEINPAPNAALKQVQGLTDQIHKSKKRDIKTTSESWRQQLLAELIKYWYDWGKTKKPTNTTTTIEQNASHIPWSLPKCC